MSDAQTDDVKLPHIGLRGESGSKTNMRGASSQRILNTGAIQFKSSAIAKKERQE
jgi:hypothetical protein